MGCVYSGTKALPSSVFKVSNRKHSNSILCVCECTHTIHLTYGFSNDKLLTLGTNNLQVTNIDDSGNEKYHGQMEINTCNLVLHKRREPPIIWPLSTVRRYGYEDSMFCFEAGRSSPYGPGIFAFKSKEAKNIFDTVKEKLQVLAVFDEFIIHFIIILTPVTFTEERAFLFVCFQY